MKTRIIQTKFWDDPELMGVSLEASHLYIYLITSGHIGLTGIFQAADQEIMLKSRLNDKQLQKAKKELQDLKKVYFYKTWIHVVNAEKHNNYGASPTNLKAISKEREEIPSNVIEVFDFLTSSDTTMDTSINTSMGGVSGVFETPDTNHKSEIRNKKLKTGDESVREGGKRTSLEDLTTDDLDEIAEIYQVPRSFVDSKLDDMTNWCSSKGKLYRDYKAALKNWVKSDAIKITKEAHGQSKIAYINTENPGGIDDPVQDQTNQRIRLSDQEAYTGQHLEGIGGGG